MWNYFIIFALTSALLWAIGAVASYKKYSPALIYGSTSLGLLIFLSYILLMWVGLGRPPMRTMGETRLWYSLFLPLAGMITYLRKRYRWVMSFGTLLAIVFICVNIFKPEIHSKSLMPALQSPWFAPHVIVYMFSYALMGVAALTAIYILWQRKTDLSGCDDLVYLGIAFLTIGMLFGAVWAKEAWGTYWAWDPKETWAAITWFTYLLYIHYRRIPTASTVKSSVLLIVAFIFLQVCWWGINYLPAAQNMSMHTYTLD
jgi:ABC-type transport system involved in cytochrome c biogenesis permease subunit